MGKNIVREKKGKKRKRKKKGKEERGKEKYEKLTFYQIALVKCEKYLSFMRCKYVKRKHFLRFGSNQPGYYSKDKQASG